MRFFNKQILGILVIIVLITALPLTVITVKKRQDVRQKASESTATEFGVQIDVRDEQKIPSASQGNQLNPRWVRFVFPCTNSSANNNSCPQDYHSTNVLNRVPTNIKQLAIITGDSTWNAPVGSNDPQVWNRYTDTIYVPTLLKIITENPNLSAIELMNEEDNPNDLSSGYLPYIPPTAYAHLITAASNAAKQIRPSLIVVTGGLSSGSPTDYLLAVKQADPNAFARIDAIGIHPYVGIDQVNGLAGMLTLLKTTLEQNGIAKPVWVTEMGIEEFTSPSAPHNQREYLDTAFNQFRSFRTPVAIWYGLTDLMQGTVGGPNRGLVDGNGAIKPSGLAFSSFTTAHSPTPCPGRDKGNANGDCIVNILDFSIWRGEFVQEAGGTASQKRADFNNDNTVDLVDFNIWRLTFYGQ